MSPSQVHIDLAAIDANLNLAAAAHPHCKVLLPVKANAYGHGAVQVASHVEQSGSAHWLGVAEVAEALELRAAGIKLPILKFSPAFPDELEEAVAADVTLSVGTAQAIQDVAAAASRIGKTAPVHLKLDTGMRRVGAPPADGVALAQQVTEHPNLSLDGVFTHLPVSDTPAETDYTRDQLSRFLDAVAAIKDRVGPVPWVHAGNSGAVMGHDLTGTNLIRPGIMAYGCRSDGACTWQGLTPAARWTSRVSFIKKISAGETVGYGRTWTAPQDTWIATVPVGYGDGYSRLLSNRGRMLVGGRSYPVAGRVCMDQTMLDLGPNPPQVAVGDEVVLLGKQGANEIPVEEIGDLMGTITYEVMCLLTRRVQRRY